MTSRQIQRLAYVVLITGCSAPWILLIIARRIYDPIDLYWSDADWMVQHLSLFTIPVFLLLRAKSEIKSEIKKKAFRILGYTSLIVLFASMVLYPQIRT